MRNALLTIVAALAVSGCATDLATTTTTDGAPVERASTADDAKDRALERRERRLARREAAVRRKARAARRAAAAMTSCDGNVSAKAATTTCEFAQNVFAAYWATGGGAFEAYSPASASSFVMSCTGSATVTCEAGDGGRVSFPMRAIDSYSQAQYDAYVCSHDTGDPAACVEDTPDPPEQRSDDGCDPNYEGACLDSTSSDYDCEGGSGDGPDYTGTVEVVGEDVFDLDRDGDGIACDTW